MKKTWRMAGLLLMGMLAITGCTKKEQEQYTQLQAEYDSLSKVTDQIRADYDALQEKYDSLQSDYDALNAEKENAEKTLQEYQEFMQPYYEYIMYLQSAQGQQAYAAQDNQAQMEQLAQSYETGITYKQLCEAPETYVGQKIKLTGTIVGGTVENGELRLIMAVDGDEKQLMLFAGSADWASGGIEEGVQITVYGVSGGLFDYTDESGTALQIPGASLDYVIPG